MIRTPKEWTETCSHCKGCGTVQRREWFALWTPEEYEQAMGKHGYGPPKIDPKYKGADDLPPNAVICTAHGGSSIFEACKEGVKLAFEYNRPVVFEFNNAIAVCHIGADPDKVAKTWWKLAYGETYEESAAKR